MNKHSLSAEARRKTILSIVLGVICVIYVLPVLTVVINSFKLNTYVKTDTFALPNAESFAGWANFIKGLTFGNYPFLKSAGYSLFITIVSTALILLCTSMAAWYIARVDSKFCRMVYYLCVFSMVVPFQMVMFTLSKTADTLKLNTPWTIPIIYLGFGAGLAVFMFAGFVKNIPLEIEEAAIIQDIPWIKRMTRIIIPIQKSSIISGFLLPFMTCLRELSLFMLLCVQGFILSTTLDYFDEMGLYAFSSGINLILIVTILVCNTLVNKITGASLDKGIGG